MLTEKSLSGLVVLVMLLSGTVLRGRFPRVPFWSVMMLCAAATLLLGLVGLDEAASVIDLDVIMLLIGMFALVGMAEHSGLLDFIANYFLSRVYDTRKLLVGSSLLFGLMSAFFVNDTVALLGPPIAVTIGKALGGRHEPVFLLLCYSITVGSVMTPIGNPQNVLVALQSGMRSPFVEFIMRLAVPTLVSLIALALVIERLYRVPLTKIAITVDPWESVRSRREFFIALLGGGVTVAALIANDVLAMLGQPHVNARGLIPFVAAAALWTFTDSPREVLSRVDFGTVLFFMGMFIAVEGIWRSGLLQPLFGLMALNDPTGLTGLLTLSAVILLISQLISNVPYTKLAIQHLKELGVGAGDLNAWLTLATAATLAGNITVFGAASNVIVLEVLESRYGVSIPYFRFTKVGLLVTAIVLPIYLPFLLLKF
jgi:Na+/H+ antiporter NhaD/arsenite permease-like protein